jgi:hypothetical protein
MLVDLVFLTAIAAAKPSPTAVYDAAAQCRRTLVNNDILEPEVQVVNEIYHTLTIKNGGQDAAFVSVVDQSSGARVLFYVDRGRSATIGLNDGDYVIKYALSGRLAADCSTVIRPSYVGEFPGVKHLRVVEDANGYTTDVLKYTLYSVPHGNVRPRKISVADFNRD